MILTVPGPADWAECVNSEKLPEVEDVIFCPAGCQRVMWRHTGYPRRVTTGDGKVLWLWITRRRCKECRLVISCLFDFLVPYVIYTVQAIAAWAATYSQEQMTYDLLPWAAGTPDAPRSTVFRRVAACVEQSEALAAELQTEAMLNQPENVQMESPVATCPNTGKARTARKAHDLNRTATLLATAGLLLRKVPQTGQGILVVLHRYFMSTAEELRSIFFQRKDLALSNQQSPRCIIF
jgi:hypothetical protein